MACPTSHGETAGDSHLLARLDQLVDRVLADLAGTPAWRSLASDADSTLARKVLRELYRRAWAYHRHVFEASASFLGRFPKEDATTIRDLFLHLAEEATHGDMAMKAFAELGGSETRARAERIPPSSFAVASVWRGLAEL